MVITVCKHMLFIGTHARAHTLTLAYAYAHAHAHTLTHTHPNRVKNLAACRGISSFVGVVVCHRLGNG